MHIEVTALRYAPPFAQGYVKDLRIRWALEEAGFPYEMRLIDPDEQQTPGYRKWQPFGQVPAYRDDEVSLFESGAIVLHIAARSEMLASTDPAERDRIMSWVFAALNSVEPHAQNVIQFGDPEAGGAWAQARYHQLVEQLTRRLKDLTVWLGASDYLEGRFTAADLMMATVLRELSDSDLLLEFPMLRSYLARCLARPAFGRALAGQMETFR